MNQFNKKLLTLWTIANKGKTIKDIDDYKKIFSFFLKRQEPFGGVSATFVTVSKVLSRRSF